jgi:hypothetical protein
MLKINKKGKFLLYSIPIVVGVYLIFMQFSKAKKAKSMPVSPTPPQPQTPTKPTQKTANDSFPLQIGSRDAGAPLAPAGRVVALQKMINQKGYLDNGVNKLLKEDGIFGPKTATAVEYWIEQDSVDNLDDWNLIFRKIAPFIAAPPSYDVLQDSYKITNF